MGGIQGYPQDSSPPLPVWTKFFQFVHLRLNNLITFDCTHPGSILFRSAPYHTTPHRGAYAEPPADEEGEGDVARRVSCCRHCCGLEPGDESILIG